MQMLKTTFRGMASYMGLLVERSRSGCREATLTFDDGPTEHYTMELISCLRKRGVKATFFVVGENVVKHPESFKSLIREGHDIANHSMNHHRIEGLSYMELESMFESVNSNILKLALPLTCANSNFIRPPFGKLTLNLFIYAIRKKKRIIMWSKDPEDFLGGGVKELNKFFYEHPPSPGDIVLMHDKEISGIGIEMVERTIEWYNKFEIRLVALRQLIKS